jgi:hypothetical protein
MTLLSFFHAVIDEWAQTVACNKTIIHDNNEKQVTAKFVV